MIGENNGMLGESTASTIGKGNGAIARNRQRSGLGGDHAHGAGMRGLVTCSMSSRTSAPHAQKRHARSGRRPAILVQTKGSISQKGEKKSGAHNAYPESLPGTLCREDEFDKCEN